MMLKPTVQEMTNSKVNRYKLVIATAKCARHIVDKANEEREFEEKHRNDPERIAKEPCEEAELLRETNPVKDSKSDDIFERECEKPVSEAVIKIVDDEFKIIVPSETPTK